MHELRAALQAAARTSGPIEPRTDTTAILSFVRSVADGVASSQVGSQEPVEHDPFEPDPFADDAYGPYDGTTTRSPPFVGDDLPTVPRVPPPRRPPGSQK
jgi:hypothetical protein